MKKNYKKIIAFFSLIAIFVSFQNFRPSDTPTVDHRTIFGANFNKNPKLVDIPILDKNDMHWARASMNMVTYIRNSPLYEDVGADRNPFGRVPDDQMKSRRLLQEDIDGFERLNQNNKNLILTLRWHFNHWEKELPPANSTQERFLFSAALDVLDQVGYKAKIIIVGNEPEWETLPEDKTYANGSSGKIPMAMFYRRLAGEVHRYLVNHRRRDSTKILLGSFNKLHLHEAQRGTSEENKAIERMLSFARNMDHIDGIDVHTHVGSIEEMETQLAYARRRIGPDKMILVAETSLVWAFKRNQEKDICRGVTEQAFCQKYGIQGPILQRVYSNDLMALPEAQKPHEKLWNDFLTSRSYLPQGNGGELKRTEEVFNRYNVAIATLGGFVEEGGSKLEYKKDEIPWGMSGMHIPKFARRNGEELPVNKEFAKVFKTLRKK